MQGEPALNLDSEEFSYPHTILEVPGCFPHAVNPAHEEEFPLRPGQSQVVIKDPHAWKKKILAALDKSHRSHPMILECYCDAVIRGAISLRSEDCPFERARTFDDPAPPSFVFYMKRSDKIGLGDRHYRVAYTDSTIYRTNGKTSPAILDAQILPLHRTRFIVRSLPPSQLPPEQLLVCLYIGDQCILKEKPFEVRRSELREYLEADEKLFEMRAKPAHAKAIFDEYFLELDRVKYQQLYDLMRPLVDERQKPGELTHAIDIIRQRLWDNPCAIGAFRDFPTYIFSNEFFNGLDILNPTFDITERRVYMQTIFRGLTSKNFIKFRSVPADKEVALNCVEENGQGPAVQEGDKASSETEVVGTEEIKLRERASAARVDLEWLRTYQSEELAFKRLLPSLLKKMPGQFVAIYLGEVVDSDSNDVELRRRFLANYQDKYVFIEKVMESVDSNMMCDAFDSVGEYES